jgi:hypothetical protein
MNASKLYDHFDKEALDQDLWKLVIPDTVYEKDVSLKIKNSVLKFEVTKRKKSKGPYDWEGPRLVAKKEKISGTDADIGLDFRECRGYGNVYMRGNGYEFLYLLGIDYPSSDIFYHVFDVNTGRYIPQGRIHHKDYFPHKTTLVSPLLVELGLKWNGKTCYSINDLNFTFDVDSTLPEIRERLSRDSKEIMEKGLREFSIKVDLYTPHEDEPSSIKALIDRVNL